MIDKSGYLCRARFFLKLCVQMLFALLISSKTMTARKEGVASQSWRNEVTVYMQSKYH